MPVELSEGASVRLRIDPARQCFKTMPHDSGRPGTLSVMLVNDEKTCVHRPGGSQPGWA